VLFRSNAGIDRTTPVSVNLKDVPMRKALTTILANLPARGTVIRYVIEDGVVTVSTREDLESADHQLTHVYNVRDLLANAPESYAGSPAVALRSIIENNIRPLTWRDAGGTIGVIEEFKGLLTITTTSDIHLEIAKFLANLRAADKGVGVTSVPKKITPKSQDGSGSQGSLFKSEN
jgi:hypothetical protein